MKKTSKILLSTLTIFSMFFTMTVNAEELTSTPSGSQTNQVAPATTTTKSLKDLTEEELNNIIPNTIEINVTKTDYANYIIKTDFQAPEGEDIVDKALEEKFIEIFNTNGITNVLSSDFSVGCELRSGTAEIENGSISISGTNYVKDFTIKYAKESNFNATDETYVKNAVKNIKFANYEGTDAVFTMYNIGDEENASKWTENTYDFSKLLNDTSITIKRTIGARGQGGGTPWGVGTILYFYKNDVLYDLKHIMNMGAYGTTLENGTLVNMAELDKEYDKELYEELEKELNNRGFTNIIGAYELTAYGTTTNNMKISFTLGNNYNGKEVQILHKKSDNTYEIFTTTVADGKATITVSEFSPFMIALSENNTTVNNAPNNAQTSSIDIVLYSILAIGSLLGITYIVVKNRKKVA